MMGHFSSPTATGLRWRSGPGCVRTGCKQPNNMWNTEVKTNKQKKKERELLEAKQALLKLAMVPKAQVSQWKSQCAVNNRWCSCGWNKMWGATWHAGEELWAWTSVPPPPPPPLVSGRRVSVKGDTLRFHFNQIYFWLSGAVCICH